MFRLPSNDMTHFLNLHRSIVTMHQRDLWSKNTTFSPERPDIKTPLCVQRFFRFFSRHFLDRVIFLQFKKIYWSIADLQCCSFLLYSNAIQLYTHTHTHTHIYIYIYILYHILLHYGLSQDVEYSTLCCTVGPCCLSIFI